MKKFFLFLPSILSVAFAQIPVWFSTHAHPRYPPSEYIIGVGTGGGAVGMETAKKAALADIVSQLRVHIQSEMKSVTENYSVNDDEQIYSDFQRRSRTIVNDEITGADVVETVVDEQNATTYALVVLNREKYSAGLRVELESGWKQASDLRFAAKDFFSKGNLNEAIQSIHQIKQVLAPLFAKQVLYNAASRTPFAFPLVFNPAALQNDIRTFLSAITVTKKSGDHQQGKIGEQFQQPFVVGVTANGIPCTGVTVLFLLDGKTYLGEELTNTQGIASFSTFVRKGREIRAKVSLKDVGREFDQNLNSSSVNFTWNAQAPDKAFSIIINSESRKIDRIVQAKISSAVSQIGYKIVTMSNNTISVEVNTNALNKVEGMTGTLFTLTLEVTVNVKENRTNTIVGLIKFFAKGVGKSENEATEKAANSLNIDQKELAELLRQ